MPAATVTTNYQRDAAGIAASPLLSAEDAGPRHPVASRIARQAFDVLMSVYQEHRLVLRLTFAYIVLGGLILTTLDRPWPIALTNTFFSVAWAAASALWLCWQYLRSPRHLRRALEAPRCLGAVLVALLAIPIQITLQSLKQSIGPVVGFRADPFLHRLDVLLHGRMAWQWLDEIFARPWLVRSIDRLYMLWFVGLFLFVIWASWSKHRALRQRALIAFLLVWIGGGTITAALVPSAGPCYFSHVVAGGDAYDGLIARLDSIGAEHGELWGRSNQKGLWDNARSGQWRHFAGISAMPSLHVGVAVLLTIVAWQVSRFLGGVLALCAAAIQVGSVVLAWHYAIDGYLGAIIAIASWRVAGSLCNREQVHRHDTSPLSIRANASQVIPT